MALSTFGSTRRSLHGVAEWLLAGPQYVQSGTIRLRVLPGGFGTRFEPTAHVVDDQVVVDDQAFAITGRSIATLGSLLGIEPCRPDQLYRDGSGVSASELLEVDPDVAAAITGALAIGQSALHQFAPSADPVLWPEHFDLGIVVDGVAYGVSPGDSFSDEPYAYISLDDPPPGDFFTAPFGAAIALRALGSAERAAGFFATGRSLVVSAR